MVKFSPKTAEITLAVQQQQTGDLGERAAPNTGCIVLIQYRDSLSPPLPSVARQNKQQIAICTPKHTTNNDIIANFICTSKANIVFGLNIV